MPTDLPVYAEITPDTTARIRHNVGSDASLTVPRNAVTNVGLNDAALDRTLATSPLSMQTKLDKWQVTNQKRSGRCWLFAALNLMRVGAMEKLNVKDFQFSQNYAMFWEKFERANYFLATQIELAQAGEPLDGRLEQFLLSDVLSDGGQWDMLVGVFQKYGVVPQEAQPETHASSNTERMNSQLRLLLRRTALELRDMVTAGATAAELDAKREAALEQVYQILTIALGTPPAEFDWQWRDKDEQFHSDGTLTPQQFFDRYVDLDLAEYVCLVDDPRREHPKDQPLTVAHLGNVVGGPAVLYLNADIALMKDLAARSIESGEPVWFGCDVGQQSDRKAGLMLNGIYDYAGTLAVDLSTTKEQRVIMGESMMTHAMLLTGVDRGSDGQPRRWRVENSWGDEVGEKGFFTMDDAWFDQYVFEVAVKKSELPAELAAALDLEPTVLPAWDPMGALA